MSGTGPTIGEVLERVAKVKDCPYDDETRAGWLLALEGQLREEFYPRYCYGGGAVPEGPRQWPEDREVPLSVPAPWDRVYDLYVMLLTDYQSREYQNYNNALAMYNQAMDEFRKHWHRTHMPRQPGCGCKAGGGG